jgi:hypothetical protein
MASLPEPSQRRLEPNRRLLQLQLRHWCCGRLECFMYTEKMFLLKNALGYSLCCLDIERRRCNSRAYICSIGSSGKNDVCEVKPILWISFNFNF